MSARGKVWLIGLAVSAVPVGWMTWRDVDRELGVPIGLLALGVIALLAELSSLGPPAASDRAPSPPSDVRAADGVVGRATMRSVESDPLELDPRWRSFVRLSGETKAVASNPPPSRRNPALLGRVALFSVFVGRDGRSWTDPEVVQAHGSMVVAGTWIERQAREWGVPMNVELSDTFFRVVDDDDQPVEVAFFPEGDDVEPMEADATSKAIAAASRAAARLGFVDVVDLIGRVNDRVESDVRIWLFHILRGGRSLAIPASEGPVPGVGLAVCYARESSFPEQLIGRGRVDPTTVAHELLHLAGASDKYGIPLRNFPAGSVGSRDIMRLNFDSLSRMTIGPLTGAEIGWRGRRILVADTKKNRP